MSDHTPTGADQGHDPTAWPTMRAAGEQLGMTPNAIRQRIRRGSLTALKVDGIWRVQLPAPTDDDRSVGGRPGPQPPPYGQGAMHGDTATHTTRDTTDQGAIEAQYRVTPAEIEQAIERTGDKYVTDMRAMFDEVGRLYQGQLAAKDETIAELRRRAEVAESRVSVLVHLQAESLTQATSAPLVATDAATGTPWWQFWRR